MFAFLGLFRTDARKCESQKEKILGKEKTEKLRILQIWETYCNCRKVCRSSTMPAGSFVLVPKVPLRRLNDWNQDPGWNFSCSSISKRFSSFFFHIHYHF